MLHLLVLVLVFIILQCSDGYYHTTTSIVRSNIRLRQSFQEYLKNNATDPSSSASSVSTTSFVSSAVPQPPPLVAAAIQSSSSSSAASSSSSAAAASSSSSSSSSPSSSSLPMKVLSESKTIKISLMESSSSPSSSSSKPSLLFLPGLDGQGSYSSQALSNLSVSFNFYKMTVDASDRSTFLEVTDLIIEAINKLDNVVLAGESMGGLFASYVASRRPKAISKLILINPATSYERTFWPTVGPLVASTGPLFPVVGIATLLLTAVEIDQFQRIGQNIISQINSTDSAIQVLNSLRDSASSITTTLGPDTLNWRLTRWLGKGNFYLDNRVENIVTPTLILVGKNDKLLPSSEEGRRLKKLMKNSNVELIELDNKGHAILDGSYDLADLILTSKTFLRDLDPSEVYCPFPNSIDIEKADKQVGNLIKAFSPVFLSRRADGVIVKGISELPTGKNSQRPCLFVGNHQLYGADLAIIIKEFLNSKNELVRGLAHPALFMDNDGNTRSANGMSDSNVRDLFKTFGAVKVSPDTIFQLLQRNESVLLFPGGVKEAYHLKDEQYKLLWPEKTDFIRMAGLFNAIIIPFAAIGIADSVQIIADRNDIISIPFLGERAVETSNRMPQARPGGNDSFIAPIGIPKFPSRNYFIFETPIDTRDLNVYDKKESKKYYDKVKNSVERGIQTLIKIRESDPFKDYLPRLAYETITGQETPIPPLNRFE